MNLIKSTFILSLLTIGNTQAAFVNAYDLANWTKTIDGGSIDTITTPNSVVLTSSNDFSNENKNQDFTITAVQDGIVSFAWSYESTDLSAKYDPYGWLINGAFIQLTNDFEGFDSSIQSGVFLYQVFAGNVFGFRANSTDSYFGAATTTISNFNVSTPVFNIVNQLPLPTAFWLIIAPLMSMLRKKRQSN